jgi:hypothetical protein
VSKFLANKSYRDKFESFLNSELVPAGYSVTKNVRLDPVPESIKYEGLIFALNDWDIIYRKGKVTPDRPGAFLAVWRRPIKSNINSNKPVPFIFDELDYLFVQVEKRSNEIDGKNLDNRSKKGMFIFPVSLLIDKGIVASSKSKGKTGFRVFPPWTQDRGVVGTKVFSGSGKKTQCWQLPYFLVINEGGKIDTIELGKILSLNDI